MVRVMPWNQVHMNKMQTAVTNIYLEMKKKNMTSVRLVLDETEMLQAKAESDAKTKGERS